MADPELARADLLRRERAGLPAETANADSNVREPVAVLADCLDREAAEESATEYQRHSLARADHLGLLHARWADQVKTADRERYQQIVQQALPPEWRGQLSPQADPIGPEPVGSSPEQRAARHAGLAAHTRTDSVDVRTLPEASLWHIRDTYKAETEWAPPHVGRQLRGIRLAAENAHQQAIRSQAAARAAADVEIAERHTRMAASAEALQEVCGRIEANLAEAMEDRRAWEQITAGPRRVAVAADSELRRRNPDKQIEPLRSAEPRPPEDDQITITPPAEEVKLPQPPEWVTQLAEQRRAFQEKLGERQNVMIPAEDPDSDYLGQAWPWQQRDPDAIIQPPKPEIRPSSRIEHLAGREIPDLEAGS